MATLNAASETPTAISARDLVVQTFDEPRIPDLLLAVRLSFECPRKIRDLIERNRVELETYGDLPSKVNSPHGGANSKRGRPGRTYYLNEAQALVLCALARTPVAAEIRREIIGVFQSYRSLNRRETSARHAWEDMMVIRGVLERGVDALLDLLNFLDLNGDDEEGGDSEPDQDGEPSLGFFDSRLNQAECYAGDAQDLECEHDGREPDADGEPTLGSTEDVDQEGAWTVDHKAAGPIVGDGESEPSLGSQNVNIDGVTVTLENGRTVVVPNRTFDQGLWAEGGSSDDRELGDDRDLEHDGREPDCHVCDPIERDEGCQQASQVSDWDAIEIIGRRERPATDLLVSQIAGSSVERLRVILLKLRGRAEMPSQLFATS